MDEPKELAPIGQPDGIILSHCVMCGEWLADRELIELVILGEVELFCEGCSSHIADPLAHSVGKHKQKDRHERA